MTHSTGLDLSSDLLGALYNPFAAVPSLHFGYALIIGVALATIAERRWVRVLGGLYPAAMLLIIVATGNHFFVDAALGGLAVLVGWLAARMLLEDSRTPAPRAAGRDERRPRLISPGRGRTRPATRPCGSPSADGEGSRTRDGGAPHAQTPVHPTDIESRRCDRAGTPTPQGETRMSPMKRSTNVAARMGRWSARHWKTAIFGWLALRRRRLRARRRASARRAHRHRTRRGRASPAAWTRILDDGLQAARRRERARPERSLAHGRRPASTPRSRTSSPASRAVGAVQQRPLARSPGQRAARSRTDGHSALVEFDIRGDADKAADKIAAGRSTRSPTAQRAHPSSSIGEFGDASAEEAAVDEQFDATTSARRACSRCRSR